MAPLPPEEHAALEAFERELKDHPAVRRALTTDAEVSCMTPADQYEWLCGEIRRAADADGRTQRRV